MTVSLGLLRRSSIFYHIFYHILINLYSYQQGYFYSHELKLLTKVFKTIVKDPEKYTGC